MMLSRPQIAGRSNPLDAGPKRRRNGRVSGLVLIEVLLIGLACWVSISLVTPLFFLGNGRTVYAGASTKSAPLSEMILTSEGRELWIKRGRNELVSLNLTTQNLSSFYVSDRTPIQQWSVSQDGTTWMVSHSDAQVLIYRNEELIVSDQPIGQTQLNSLLSADGKVAVTIAGQREVQCWALSSQPSIMSEFSLSDLGNKYAIAPTGHLFVVTDRGGLQSYDTKDGQITWTPTEIQQLSREPIFSVDGRWMLIKNGNRLERYDIESRTKIWSIEDCYDDPVYCNAISPDGNWVATSRIITGIQLLDGETGKACGQCLANSAMHRLVFSATNDQLYSTGPQGLLQTWAVSSRVTSDP